MVDYITPAFYRSEAERLLQLAAATIDRITRLELLEMAARFNRMAAELHSESAETAGADDAARADSETA